MTWSELILQHPMHLFDRNISCQLFMFLWFIYLSIEAKGICYWVLCWQKYESSLMYSCKHRKALSYRLQLLYKLVIFQVIWIAWSCIGRNSDRKKISWVLSHFWHHNSNYSNIHQFNAITIMLFWSKCLLWWHWHWHLKYAVRPFLVSHQKSVKNKWTILWGLWWNVTYGRNKLQMCGYSVKILTMLWNVKNHNNIVKY